MAAGRKDYVPRSEPRSLKSAAARLFARALWLLWIAAAVAILSTTFDYVRPGQIAVIKNNLTGAETLKRTDGVVVHAPLGITRVYILDKTQQVVRMTARKGVGDRPGVDNVKVKTSDGTNVFVDVELVYRIEPEKAQTVVRTFGRDEAYKFGFVRSLARSKVRDALGELSLQEIIKAENRRAKAEQARQRINDILTTLGLVVTSLSVTDLDYSDQYKEMIAERLKLEQEIRNQEAAQKTAESEQMAAKARAERRKNTTLEQIRGEQAKRLIEAKGEAARVLKEAEAEAYRIKKMGDQQLQVALNEARAIEQEGLKRAEGVRRMVEAYRVGGLALIREALAKKYAGKRINGKPYTLDSRVERLRIEREGGGGAAAVEIKPQERGGSQ